MSNKALKRRLFGAAPLALAVAAFGMPTVGYAQLDEIIVTAQKREESLQSVPIAVTAFDANAIEVRQIESFTDLQFATPNVSFSKTNFTASNFQIRGIGSQVIAATADAGVGIHVNDIPIQFAFLFETEYYDLASLEILRGPQGTLQGRNSTGGTVNMITQKPTDEFEGNLEAEYGNFESKKVKGAINIPFGDAGAIRLAGVYVSRDGYTENLFTGNNIDGRDQFSVRGSLRLNLSDRTTLDVMATYFEEDSNRARIVKQLCHRDPTAVLGCLPDRLGNDYTNSQSTLAGILTSSLVLGPLALTPFGQDDNLANTNPSSLRQVRSDFDPTYAADETLVTAQLEHEFDRFTATIVAGYHLNSNVGETDYNWNVAETLTLPAGFAAALPFSASLFPGGLFPISESTGNLTGIVGGNIRQVSNLALTYDRSGVDEREQWSVETRLASNFDGPFSFLVGGFYLDYESRGGFYDVVATALDYFAIAAIGAPGGAGLISPFFRSNTELAGLETWAVFGDASFEFTDTLKVTGGIRYTDDEKQVQDRTTLYDTFNLLGDNTPVSEAVLPFRRDTASWQELTYRALVEWSPELEFTDSTLMYASYSRGYKGGGFNPPLTAGLVGVVGPTFEPEFIDSYEIGIKNTLLENRLQANLTAFYYNYEGLQVGKIVDRTAVNENVDAKVWGIEAEFLAAPNENWLLNLNLSYLNTEIQDFQSVDGRDPTDGRADALLIKDLSNASNCIVDPGAVPLATVIGLLTGAGALPFGTFPVPGLAAPGAFTTCAGAQAAIDFFETPAGGSLLPIDAVNVTGCHDADLTGNELPNSPEFSIAAGATYTHYFDNEATMAFRADYYWQDDMFARNFNKPIDLIESWQQVNASVQYTSSEGDYYIRAFVQNLLDNDDITGHYFTDPSSGNFTNVFVLEPRRWGLAVGVNF